MVDVVIRPPRLTDAGHMVAGFPDADRLLQRNAAHGSVGLLVALVAEDQNGGVATRAEDAGHYRCQQGYCSGMMLHLLLLFNYVTYATKGAT